MNLSWKLYFTKRMELRFGVCWILSQSKMRRERWYCFLPPTRMSPRQKCQRCRFQMSVIVLLYWEHDSDQLKPLCLQTTEQRMIILKLVSRLDATWDGVDREQCCTSCPAITSRKK
uniref:(northern house mosquito) hypothetical protein n=1 Tax=Culex pipiens TaxID=7175 RepID=A0A8D8A0D9_CULPI